MLDEAEIIQYAVGLLVAIMTFNFQRALKRIDLHEKQSGDVLSKIAEHDAEIKSLHEKIDSSFNILADQQKETNQNIRLTNESLSQTNQNLFELLSIHREYVKRDH